MAVLGVHLGRARVVAATIRRGRPVVVGEGAALAEPASSTLPEKEHPASDPASAPPAVMSTAHRAARPRGRPVVVLITHPR